MAQDRAIIGRRSERDLPRKAAHLGQPEDMHPVRETSRLRWLGLVCYAAHVPSESENGAAFNPFSGRSSHA
jgi:hypothetical protein